MRMTELSCRCFVLFMLYHFFVATSSLWLHFASCVLCYHLSVTVTHWNVCVCVCVCVCVFVCLFAWCFDYLSLYQSIKLSNKLISTTPSRGACTFMGLAVRFKQTKYKCTKIHSSVMWASETSFSRLFFFCTKAPAFIHRNSLTASVTAHA